MTKEKHKNYIFENDSLQYESFVSGFTPKIFKDFDSISKKINLNSKIEDLFSGKKVNHSEKLAAWHTKYREQKKIEKVYFSNLNILNNCKNIITIGIGGSFEGPKLLIESLVGSRSSWNKIFITGSDPVEFIEKTKNLDPSETFFIVSSKSFTTDEILITLKNAIKWSGDINKFLAITANKSEASKYKIKNILEFDKEIGGRYSIWSHISFPAFFELNDQERGMFFLGGNTADNDLKQNSEYLKFIKYLSYSDIWLNNYKNKTSRVVLSYIWKLRSFPDYVQQLEMESLGKPVSLSSKYKKTGQIIFGGYGPTAQHSYFQLLHQGTQDICADIISTNEDPKSLAYAQSITQANLLSNGAEDLLMDEEKINGNIPLNLFMLKKVNSFTLGYLIATWEHRTYVTAAMLGINPFDQFGVSAGKIFTKQYIEKNGG